MAGIKAFRIKRKNEFSDEEAGRILEQALSVEKEKALFAREGPDSLGSKDGVFRKLLRCNGHQYNAQQFIDYLSVINESFDSSSAHISKGDITKERATALTQAINYYHNNHDAVNGQLNFEDFVRLIRVFEFLHRHTTKTQKGIGKSLLQDIGKTLKRISSFLQSNIDKFDFTAISTQTAFKFMSSLIYPLLDTVDNLSLNTKNEAAKAFFAFALKLGDKYVNSLQTGYEVADAREKLSKFFLFLERKDNAPDFKLGELRRWEHNLEQREKFLADEKEKANQEAERKWQEKNQARRKEKERRKAEEEREKDLQEAQEGFINNTVIAEYNHGDESFNLTIQDMNSAKPKEPDAPEDTAWLTDKVVRMECLDQQKDNSNPDIYIFDPEDVNYYGHSLEHTVKIKKEDLPPEEEVENMTYDDIASRSIQEREMIRTQKGRMAIKEAIKDKKILICPINPSRNHWTIAFLDFRKSDNSEIVYCSSLSGYETESKEIVKKICDWFDIKPGQNAFRKIMGQSPSSIPINEQPIKQQTNARDCGPCILTLSGAVLKLHKDNPKFQFNVLADITFDADVMRLASVEKMEKLKKGYEPPLRSYQASPRERDEIARNLNRELGGNLSLTYKDIVSKYPNLPMDGIVQIINSEDKYVCFRSNLVEHRGGNQFAYSGEEEEGQEKIKKKVTIEDHYYPLYVLPFDGMRRHGSNPHEITIGSTIAVSPNEEVPDIVDVELMFSRRVKRGDKIELPDNARIDGQGKEFIPFRLVDLDNVSNDEKSVPTTNAPIVALYEEDFQHLCGDKGRKWEEIKRVADIPKEERKDSEHKRVKFKTRAMGENVKDDLALARHDNNPQATRARRGSF